MIRLASASNPDSPITVRQAARTATLPTAPPEQAVVACYDKNKTNTRNQYASPPRGNAIPAGPLRIFFTQLGAGRVSQIRSLTPNFTIVALKMWAYWCRNRQNCFSLYKFSQKGYIPLSDFYKIWRGERLQARTPLLNLTSVTFKMWAYSPQNRRNW